MSCRIVLREAKSFVKCSSCGEVIRPCEKFIQVVCNESGKPVQGERYCQGCREIAEINNEIGLDSDDDNDDNEAGLRRREEYAAYAVAGATGHFWADAEAGYVDGFSNYRGRR